MTNQSAISISRRALYVATLLVVLSGHTALAADEPPPSDAEIRQVLIRRSTGAGQFIYHNCQCPYHLDIKGHACGSRSLYSRHIGGKRLCYPADITDKMVRDALRPQVTMALTIMGGDGQPSINPKCMTTRTTLKHGTKIVKRKFFLESRALPDRPIQFSAYPILENFSRDHCAVTGTSTGWVVPQHDPDGIWTASSFLETSKIGSCASAEHRVWAVSFTWTNPHRRLGTVHIRTVNIRFTNIQDSFGGPPVQTHEVTVVVKSIRADY